MAAGALLTMLAAAAIHFGTLAHPYLLADNRHYTFYLWKDVLGPLGAARVCLAPVYAACGAAVLSAVAAQRGSLWTAGFAMCVATAVVPAGLLELRYFTVPIFVAALQLPPPPLLALAAQGAAFAAVNAATLYAFAACPFTWPEGSIARFMW